jgi:hypothetical protein
VEGRQWIGAAGATESCQRISSSLSFKLLELVNNSDLSVFRNSTLYVAEDITV